MHDNTDVFLPDTLFIIVIYNCVIAQSSAFQSLLKISLRKNAINIFIYDNSPHAQELPYGNAIIHYHHHPTNAGVSAAYNEGFRKAKQLNLKWLFLLDQDTELPDDAWPKYAHHVSAQPGHGVFAPMIIDGDQIISPFKLRWGKGIKIKRRQPGVHSFRHWCVINSGLLISCNVFESAGGYDERFPLDFSDLIFVERLSAVTSGFILIDISLIHSLSARQDKYTHTSVVLNRFEKYGDAAKLFRKVSRKKVVLIYLLLPRAVKLSLMKKDMRFLSTAFHTLFR